MRVSILMHRYDPPLQRYQIALLADEWRRQGIEVDVHHGLSSPIRGDVVFLHVDLTMVPDEYLRAIEDHPCVVNRRVRDTSKTLYCPYPVHGPEEWDGPVIVKTVRNHGGYPEREVRRRTLPGRTHNLLSRLLASGLEGADHIDPMKYPIFASARDVPAGVFSNPHLMVQRFLPEASGELYLERSYHFLGDRGLCELDWLTHPLADSKDYVSREEVPVPDEIVQARERLGFDYGRFDYLVHDGEVILLDANRTPGSPWFPELSGSRVARLAAGLASLAHREGGLGPHTAAEGTRAGAP